ncbi:MAG: glutamate--cysteine ligase [Myxococcales bacterium]|nr:glutamate--cysteine ligase [Myxococcales bacterium]
MGQSDQDPSAARPVRELDELEEVFRSVEKPRAAYRIGIEVEKFGVRAADGRPLAYDGELGVLSVLEALSERHGWAPRSETPGGPVISLERGQGSITLEPGSQLELSGAPCENIHQICTELHGHMSELESISAEMGLVWLGVGFHPTARQDQLTWVPKQRYGIMERYLPTRGAGAHDMMRRTATVQANLDFCSEADAMEKLRVCLVLAPLINAMTANSPFKEGRLAGMKSVRGEVWLNMDPSRSGLVPALWKKPELRYRDYVEWALDAGMFLFKRDGQVVANTGQTFRDFMQNGFEGHRATFADWKLHVNTLFPEARIKSTFEVRPCDSLPTDLACAVPALYTGLLYDDAALARTAAFAATFDFAEVSAARPALVRSGLEASIGSRRARDLAVELLDIARAGLEARARLSDQGKDESVHLGKLSQLVEAGRCPADLLLAGLPAEPSASEILARSRA